MQELNPLEWAVRPLKRYADFSGRSPRAEYWWFYLLTLVISILLRLLDRTIDTHNILGALFNLAVLLPWLAVTVRRLHDTNRTGWWLLMFMAAVLIAGMLAGALAAASVGSRWMSTAGGFTSLVVAAVLMFAAGATFLAFMVLPGTEGPNYFGADPYGPDDLEEVFG